MNILAIIALMISVVVVGNLFVKSLDWMDQLQVYFAGKVNIL